MISKNDFAQLLKKAEQGIAEAQNQLGILYRDGNGVPRDLHKAVYWFRKAIDQGCMEGQLRFSTSVYFFDFETECGRYYKVWKNAVQSNDPAAQTKLGFLFFPDEEDISIVYTDPEQGFFWLERAAEQGYSPAITALNHIKSFNSNNFKTADELLKAAEQGDADAQEKLAFAYLYGEKNLPQNEDKYRFWLQKANEAKNNS